MVHHGFYGQERPVLSRLALLETLEVTMICSRNALDLLADRIEVAYRRRRPDWLGAGQTSGLWQSAASRLYEVSVESPTMPIDPELFVAMLVQRGISRDPWAELTQRQSVTRYLKGLRGIIGQLRKELIQEIRGAERQTFAGKSLEEILSDSRSRISPLCCYILAARAGRFDLAGKHRASAADQHRSCPLYRQASQSLLMGQAYPCPEYKSETLHAGHVSKQFSLN